MHCVAHVSQHLLFHFDRKEIDGNFFYSMKLQGKIYIYTARYIINVLISHIFTQQDT